MRDEDKTKEQLIQELRNYRALIENSPDGILVTVPDGRIISANPAACRIYGRTEEEIISAGREGITVNDEKLQFALKERELTGSFQRELNIYRKDNSIIPIEATSTLFKDADGKILTSLFVRDISKRKRQEEAFNKVFRYHPIAMSITNADDWTYLDVNHSWEHLTGYSREEVTGRTVRDVNLWENWEKVCQKHIENFPKNINYEASITVKNGNKKNVLISTDLIAIGDNRCLLIGINDFTEMKRLQQEINRLDCLKTIGQMASSIAHEIRNPMTSIKGFLQLLANKETDPKNTEYYDLIIEELDRANDIISEFLSIARDKIVDMKPASLNVIINSLLPIIFSDAIKQDKRIIFEKGNIPNIPVNDKEIRQLILNLVRNGLEEMPVGSDLIIGTYLEEDMVVLYVRDEGEGIKPEILEKIGTPFLTTKDNGTGIGLAVCFGIAERHNANIDFETDTTGTTFYVRFKMPSNQRRELVS